MTAFADSDDMLARYDARDLGNMCSDDGNRIAEIDLGTNDKMTAALDSATGWVKSAVQQGYRYTDSQLAAITDEGLALLKDITCQIAYWILMRRRPFLKADDVRRVYKEESDDMLDKLRHGLYVLDVQVAQEAGLPSAETITRVDIQTNWNLAVDQGRGRVYPRRRTYGNR